MVTNNLSKVGLFIRPVNLKNRSKLTMKPTVRNKLDHATVSKSPKPIVLDWDAIYPKSYMDYPLIFWLNLLPILFYLILASNLVFPNNSLVF